VSKLLANHGAEVIRVDAPSGSPTLSGTRTVISANYGKKSVFLDAKSEHGREWIGRLCGGADVVISNFRPGVAKRLGLDPESLRKTNPQLISMEVSAYGATGPDAGMPGFDMVIQARTGMEARAGGRGNGPMCSRTPVTDFATATFGAIGVLVALYERLKTGRSLDVRTSLLDVGIHMMLEVVRGPDGGLVGGEPGHSDQSGFHPAECIYRCSDGWIAVAARSESMASALAKTLGTELPQPRAEWGDVERASIGARLASRPCGKVVQALEAAGVWVEVCRHDPWRNSDVDDVLFSAFEDEGYGAVRHCLDSQVRFSKSRMCTSDRLQVPIGGDTEEVLSKGWKDGWPRDPSAVDAAL
jgi:crotonobetainyl-CoA:carnitine CoA-transferase CaiB-like acyl-CoA transferase